MPVNMKKSDLLVLLDGVSTGNNSNEEFNGVEFDSRKIQSKGLFIALAGEQGHGHEYVESAIHQGAAFVLVENRDFLKCNFSDQVVWVSDTLVAFGKLARWWRSQLSCPVVGITGSMGKTTTKAMLAHILQSVSSGTSSSKSFNNHIGVPYTLCSASRRDCWVVLEMGMNHAGELEKLSAIAEPNIVAITCIAPVHMEFFTNLEAIADAKFEIAYGLTDKGKIVLNRDDVELVNGLEKRPFLAPKVVWFGTSNDSFERYRVLPTQFEGAINCEFLVGDKRASVRIPILGIHNASNAACALLVAQLVAANTEISVLANTLSTFEAPPMRLNNVKLSGERMLIDDSYNANPRAMSSSLALTKDYQHAGKKVGLVLGDMRELGNASEQYHREIGREIGQLQPSFLIAVGQCAAWYCEEAEKNGVKTFQCSDPLKAAECALKLDFDVLLVKASRGVGLDETVRYIKSKEKISL